MRFPSPEAAVRSAFSWALVTLLGGPSRVTAPDWKARRYRVLFIRDDGIGDLMVTMELLRAIKESAPAITLDLLASPSNAAFARSLPFVDDVIVHKREFLLKAWPTWRRLRRNRYDVVIDGRAAIGNVNKQTTMLMLATGAPIRIGLGGRRNDRVYSLPVFLPVVDHWIHAYVALGQPFGIRQESRDWRARLELPDADRADAEGVWQSVSPDRPRVLVNPFSASADRQWPLERFGPVIAHLRERLPHAAVIVPTMPGGHAEMERIATGAGARAIALTLPQASAVTATADLVISPDTSITVIASAFHVPVLALMRNGTGQWVPYRNDGAVAYSDDPRSLVGLPVERVIVTLDALVDRLGGARGWR